jgi:hypothetical protein
MTKTSQTAFLWFRSNNRKPVVSHVEPSAIQNPKWLGLSVIAFMLMVGGAVAHAQQPKKIYRIGYLSSVEPAADSPIAQAIRKSLHELGYIEGQNIAIEYRYGRVGATRPLSLQPS